MPYTIGDVCKILTREEAKEKSTAMRKAHYAEWLDKTLVEIAEVSQKYPMEHRTFLSFENPATEEYVGLVNAKLKWQRADKEYLVRVARSLDWSDIDNDYDAKMKSCLQLVLVNGDERFTKMEITREIALVIGFFGAAFIAVSLIILAFTGAGVFG